MERAEQITYTLQGYLEGEAEALEKHEYLRGEVYNMTGGSLAHATIATNITALHRGALDKDSPCRVFNSDAMVLIETAEACLYPDTTVVCGPLETHPEHTQAITNPSLILEVLSESTEGRDRGSKFAAYRMAPGFREHVLIAQDRPWVDRFWMNEEGIWQMESFFGLENEFHLCTMDLTLSLSDIYAFVEDIGT